VHRACVVREAGNVGAGLLDHAARRPLRRELPLLRGKGNEIVRSVALVERRRQRRPPGRGVTQGGVHLRGQHEQLAPGIGDDAADVAAGRGDDLHGLAFGGAADFIAKAGEAVGLGKPLLPADALFLEGGNGRPLGVRSIVFVCHPAGPAGTISRYFFLAAAFRAVVRPLALRVPLLAALRAPFRAPLRAVFRLGTLPPFSRASDNPIAIACLRLVTFRPDELLSVPFLRRRIVLATRLPALLPYFAMCCTSWWCDDAD
jgi:hypothetical protein